ncbi:uncharacterized protein N7483_002964 [Penicillium malachiteum]|uniref:uncharacterized protein n=1 Tax=Penicillium malachiteum TaxID=1324776 RepID=UPI002546E808|nr:uncharacterized protein N7483_002964 [Penicillium malachiteum]KAJ5737839.1 hypothetical protein N7483_002964 [Penicillium malachiteum]
MAEVNSEIEIEIETETYETVTATANFEILAMRLPSVATWIEIGAAEIATLILETHVLVLAEVAQGLRRATSVIRENSPAELILT